MEDAGWEVDVSAVGFDAGGGLADVCLEGRDLTDEALTSEWPLNGDLGPIRESKVGLPLCMKWKLHAEALISMSLYPLVQEESTGREPIDRLKHLREG